MTDKEIMDAALKNHIWSISTLAISRTANKDKLGLLSDYLTFLEDGLFGSWLDCTDVLSEDSPEYKKAFNGLSNTDKENVYRIVKYRDEIVVVCISDSAQCYYCYWRDKVYSSESWGNTTQLGYYLNRAIDLKYIESLGGFYEDSLKDTNTGEKYDG